MAEECGRAHARCEWCGSSDVLADENGTWPVVERVEWPGTYHLPHRAAYEQALGQVS